MLLGSLPLFWGAGREQHVAAPSLHSWSAGVEQRGKGPHSGKGTGEAAAQFLITELSNVQAFILVRETLLQGRSSRCYPGGSFSHRGACFLWTKLN